MCNRVALFQQAEGIQIRRTRHKQATSQVEAEKKQKGIVLVFTVFVLLPLARFASHGNLALVGWNTRPGAPQNESDGLDPVINASEINATSELVNQVGPRCQHPHSPKLTPTPSFSGTCFNSSMPIFVCADTYTRVPLSLLFSVV